MLLEQSKMVLLILFVLLEFARMFPGTPVHRTRYRNGLGPWCYTVRPQRKILQRASKHLVTIWRPTVRLGRLY